MDDIKIHSEYEKNILEQRSKLFAQPKNKSALIKKSTILVFTLNSGEKYAIHDEIVNKVLNAQTITAIPRLNSVFAGLVNIHSQTYPVINVRNLLNLNKIDTEYFESIILITYKFSILALAVGSIIGLVTIDKKTKLNQLNKNKVNQLIDGIYGKDIAVINTNNLFDTVNRQDLHLT